MKTGDKELNLINAARKSDIDIVRQLLNEGADVNATGEGYTFTTDFTRMNSALHLAATNADEDIVRLLLENGASVNLWALGTPLHRAIKSNAQKIVNLLLDYGADLEIHDAEDNMCPLAIAAKRGQVDLVRLLLQRGANVHALSGNGFSALHYAAESDHVDVAQLLIDNGADVNSRKPKSFEKDPGTTPLHLAALNGNIKMAQFLLEHGAEVNAIEYSPLVYRGVSGWREPKPGPALNRGRTPLHYAAMHNQLETAEYLLKQGVDVNKQDLYNWTAFDYAIEVSVGKYFIPFDKPKKSPFPEMIILLRRFGAKERSWWARTRERKEREQMK